MEGNLALEELEYCRICLRRNLRLIAISKDVQNSFYLVTQLELIKTFGLSTLICQTCEKQLNNAKKYRDKLFDTELKLQSSIQQIKPEEIQLQSLPSCTLSIERVLTDDFDLIEEENVDEPQEAPVEKEIPQKISHHRKSICQICNRPVTASYMKHHIARLHLSVKDFTCDLCGRQFYKKATLISHMNLHMLNSKPFGCTYKNCSKHFASQQALATHVRFHHTGFNSHVCETCGKGYKQRRLLDEHIRSRHTGERAFKCNYEGCDAGFFSIGALRKHLAKCHENKPETCPTCGKVFKSLNNLQAHQRLSHSKITFVCDFPDCNKKYPNRIFLLNHMKSHSDIREYQCEQCDKKFLRKAHKQRHVLSVHEKAMKIVCEVESCQRILSRMESYKHHLLNVHKELEPKEVESLILSAKRKSEDLIEYIDYEALDENFIEMI